MTTTEEKQASGTGAKPRRFSLTKIATIVTVAGGIAGLITFLQTQVGDPPAAAFDASIESAELLPTRERLGAFLREQNESTRGLTRFELAEEGLVFLVRVRLQGKLGETLVLRWRMYRSDGRPVRGPAYDHIVGRYTAENQDHARRAVFWAAYPPRPGSYYARFTLIDSKEEPIDDLITERFRIRRVPSV